MIYLLGLTCLSGIFPAFHSARNLASWGRAMQSSTESSADANRAIDGNKDLDARHNSCSQTKESSFPWWVLDLQGTYTVATISITVRRDCCTEQFLGAEVYIASSMESENNNSTLCGTVYSIIGLTVTMHCALTPVRYVYITIPGHRRVLTLCEVEVFGSQVHSSLNPAINVAIKGTAVQSSVEYGGIASRAIDGNKNVAGGVCTQTTLSNDPWWRLDLKRTYAVTTVKITNRMDCCSERIKGARILIGASLENNGNSNNLCATVQTVKQSYTFICEGFIGRYVNIMVPGPNRILALCEVEVFGTRLPTVEGTVNLALLGRAIQSSTDENGEAARAIDGSKSADANERSCTRTSSSINPWWMLDLDGTYIVATVRITNRQDCCSERLVGAEVRIKTVKEHNLNSDKLCGIVRTVSSTFTFNCHYFMGQYLLISIPGFDRLLTLCEVEVFGWKDNRTALHKILGLSYMPPILSDGRAQVNLALRGIASQSSFYSLADAQRAIDGSNNWNSKMGSCTETKQGQNPWWRLDLKSKYAISTVRITNRMDCCSSRILGAEVRIGNSTENTGSANRICGIVKTVSESYTFNCPGFTGQYVNIMLPGPNEVLALCEVEVFGTETPLN